MNNKFIVASLVILFLGIVSVSAVDLTVNSPSSQGNYSSKVILVNLSTANEISDFFYLSSTGSWTPLCKNTKRCIKKMTFKEGNNTVSFKAVNQTAQTDTKIRTFLTDTKKPKISKITPKGNSFINKSKEFFIEYTEENLKNITLVYGLDNSPTVLPNTTCPSGKNKNCTFSPTNLDNFSGIELRYWFEINDVAGNKETSKKTIVRVDTTNPVNKSFTHEVNRTKVKFVFEIEEINFDKIIYTDRNDFYPVESKTLCSRLSYGRCDVTKIFKPGSHTLNITAFDKAGNSKDIRTDLEFTIY